MLQNLLQHAMKEKGLSTRDVGAKLDVSHTTISRALRGEQIDLGTLIKIADWLNMRPATLLNTLVEDVDLDIKIEALIEAYPEVKAVLEKAAEAIENGLADPGLIKDIVSYAEYRIQSIRTGEEH